MKKTMITGALALTLALTAGTGLAAQTIGPVANTYWARPEPMLSGRYKDVLTFEIYRFTATSWGRYMLYYGATAKARQSFKDGFENEYGKMEWPPEDHNRAIGQVEADQTYTQSGDTVTLRAAGSMPEPFDFTGWTKVPGTDASKWPANLVYDPSVAPAELRGTWVRKGADSGRDFDTTLTVTANQIQWKYSDGGSITETINSIRAITNDAANKAAEYPAGWLISVTVTAVENRNYSVGQNMNRVLIPNAPKNRLTQRGDDVKDIFVKQ